jgi:nicotinamidase-related amidase
VLAYSDDLILLEITFISGRPREKKLRLLKALNDNIVAAVGISSDDLMITLYETPGENISFGRGLAQRAHISDRSCRRHTGLLRTAPPGPGRDDEINGWTYIAPIQTFGHERRLFEAGAWGGTFRDEFTPLPGEVVAQEHWCSSGFANTDLDLQLKKCGIHRLIVIGLRANTCIDATVRFAAELGYDVTLVKDAIASYRWEEMQATLEINLPNYATSILSAADTIAALEHTHEHTLEHATV